MSSPQTSFTPTPPTPRRFAALGTVWAAFALPVGRAVFGLTLLCLFYGVFTPVGFLLRLAGRDVLALRHRPGRATYWAPKSDNDGLRARRPVLNAGIQPE